MGVQTRRAAITSLLLAGLLMAGCGGGASDNYRDDRYEANSADQGRLLTPGGKREGAHHSYQDNRVNDDNLATIAEQVPGVESASVVMNGPDVIVGIQVDNTGKQRIIEQQVQSALAWQYAEYNYYVTANQSLYEQIHSIKSSQLSGGYRAKSLNGDFDTIIRAIARASVRP